MKVIVTYKNYHSMDRREILPEVFKIKGKPEDALRKMWEDDYNGAISDNLYNDLNDPIDEENCWLEEDMAMITWEDGDTKEYYVIDVEKMEERDMIKTITREQYENYVTDFVAYTGEQWLQNGIEIVFTLECDDDYYYLTVEIASHVYDFYDENPDYDRDILNETEKFCNGFGCKMCETLDEVNSFVRKELPSYCEFAETDDGTIYGN